MSFALPPRASGPVPHCSHADRTVGCAASIITMRHGSPWLFQFGNAAIMFTQLKPWDFRSCT
jgi:hypothetical protein